MSFVKERDKAAEKYSASRISHPMDPNELQHFKVGANWAHQRAEKKVQGLVMVSKKLLFYLDDNVMPYRSDVDAFKKAIENFDCTNKVGN